MVIRHFVATHGLQADKEEIEEELEYEELRIIRERIFFKLRRENKVVSCVAASRECHMCLSVYLCMYLCVFFLVSVPQSKKRNRPLRSTNRVRKIVLNLCCLTVSSA